MNFDRGELRGVETVVNGEHPLAGRLRRLQSKARDNLIATQLELLAHLADLKELNINELARKLQTTAPNIHQRIKSITRRLGIGASVKKGAPGKYVYAVALSMHGQTERALEILEAIEGVPVKRVVPAAPVPAPPEVVLPDVAPAAELPELETAAQPPAPAPPQPSAPMPMPAPPVLAQAAQAPLYGPGVSLELPDPQTILEVEIVSGFPGDKRFAEQSAKCRGRGMRAEQLIAYPSADPGKTLTMLVMVRRENNEH